MSDSGWFAVGALLLLLALAVGWRRWWRPSPPPERGLATAVVIVAGIGALVGTPFWWFDLPASFAWDLTPVASRLLAAAAFAFAVACVLALERADAGGTELLATLVAVYLAPLVAAILALHLDRFDPAAPITWGFFVAAGGLACAALLAVRRRAEHSGAGDEVEPPVSAVMLLAGIAFGIWGAAMFVHPAAPFRAAFPWPRDPLTARLIAVMLLSLGTALLLGRRQRPQAEIAFVFCAAYGFGVVCAWAVTRLGGATFPPLYAAALAGLGALSAALWWRQRRPPETLAAR